jgi:hypothetical protein
MSVSPITRVTKSIASILLGMYTADNLPSEVRVRFAPDSAVPDRVPELGYVCRDHFTAVNGDTEAVFERRESRPLARLSSSGPSSSASLEAHEDLKHSPSGGRNVG